ncbi:MAG: NAD nucleotidase [Oceanospirillaceae bacterium]|nr:NAD nucleotidase [Oceanospirillaceae bacterium]MBT12600.1 NAD nucleotidase [Oceanospirillaceae bacterium]|tara:strand:- start:92405 stop:94225 length:1821 start_codon:yes stop_codon:yes gene_type:complete
MISKTSAIKTLAMAIPVAVLVGCGSDDDDKGPLSLNILHINDHHSHLEQDSVTLDIAGQATEFSSGGFPRVVAQIAAREAQLDNVLTLHAGDALTGTLYFSSFEGEADAALMNQVCFDAFALGNHEFDRGDSGLKDFLDDLHSGSCQTPVLAANVIPQVGTPLAPQNSDDYIKPYEIFEVDGHRVAVIGIDIKTKTEQSSSPLATTQFLDEVTTAQNRIDELKASGIDKIILMTHYQYDNDVSMAAQLTDVDVIVGGDSHTLLGDFSGFGMDSSGDYPTIVTNADGDTTCVVQAWQYAQVVGELNVQWNNDGTVDTCSGTPYLLLGDEILREDAEENEYTPEGEELAAIEAALDAAPQLAVVTPDAAAQTVLDTYTTQLDTFRNNVIGTASEDLCLARIPGRAYGDETCEGETDKGSDIANVVAQAFLYLSKNADIAIQNGGGVREDIFAGNITIGDAYTLLPFANTLTDLEMTGAEIRQVLNEAVDYAHTPDGSTGAYPYGAGIRWTVDMNRPAGQRLYNIEVRERDGSSWEALQDTDELIVVSNSYTAAGRDGYVTFGTVSADGRATDTFLDYAQSFVDYMQEVSTIGKPAAQDYSTQSYTAAD